MKSILLFFIVLLQISAGQAAETLLDFSSADNHWIDKQGQRFKPKNSIIINGINPCMNK
jgi:hypothetical protein